MILAAAAFLAVLLTAGCLLSVSHVDDERLPLHPGETPQMPEYKGAPLSPERGPGLGCFWIQVVALVVFIVLAPLSAVLNWGAPIATALLIGVVILLLLVGQTAIFLLRLVAADRRGRRAPLASRSKTVGELEDEAKRASGGTEDGGVGESR